MYEKTSLVTALESYSIIPEVLLFTVSAVVYNNKQENHHSFVMLAHHKDILSALGLTYPVLKDIGYNRERRFNIIPPCVS